MASPGSVRQRHGSRASLQKRSLDRNVSKSDEQLDRIPSPPVSHPTTGRFASVPGPSVADFVGILHGDGLLTDEEAETAAANLERVPVEMRTDSMRIILMNMVKHGKLTVAAVEQYAAQFEIDSQSRKQQADEVYNFSVYKWNKMRNAQRRILQFDFQSRTMLNMARGTIHKTFNFSDIVRYEGDEDERFYVYFANHHEYELEADSIEEKNKIFKILNRIIDASNAEYDSEGGDLFGTEDSSEPPEVIKQGQLEKKGHSVAFFTWAKRWVKISNGELSYFKMDDVMNPLNSIQLGQGFATVKKEDVGGFVVSTSTKDFHFRIANPNNQRPISAVSHDRDTWIEALTNAASSKRRPAARVSGAVVPAATTAEGSQSGTIDMIKLLRKELKQLAQSMTLMYGSNTAAAPLRKVQQMAKAIEDQATRQVPLQPVTPQTGTMTVPLLKESGFKSFRTKLKRKAMAGLAAIRPLTVHDASPRKGAQISAPMPVVGPVANVNQPSVVSATAAQAPSLIAPSQTNLEKSMSASALPSSPPPVVPTPYVPKSASSSVLSSFSPPPPPTTTTGSGQVNGLSSVPETSIVSNRDSVVSDVFETAEKATNEVEYETIKDDTAKFESSEEPEATYTVITDTPVQVKEEESEYVEVGTTETKALPIVSVSEPAPDDNKGEEKEPPPPPLPPLSPEDSPQPPPPPPPPLPPFSPEGSPQPPPPPPPPPSPLGEGIPPPPPPPLSPLGEGMPPPPPPPPGAPGSFGAFRVMNLPPKRVINPGRKMRPLHWYKVPNMMVPKSFWVKANDKTNELDSGLLEELFCVEESTATPAPAKKASAPKSLLDSQRAQNLGIFLSGFKLSINELDARLYEVDEDRGLPLEHVIALKRFQPATEEKEMYKNFEGNKSLLSHSDQFMMKLCDLPSLSLRLELLLTIREFPVQFEELLPSISTALGACNELATDANFCAVLEYALSIGNYLNGGTARGCAYGVKLNSLPKLADTRARGNPKFTLMHYLVKIVQEKNPTALDFVNSMPNVSKSADSSVKALVAEVEIMKKDLKRIGRNADNLLKKEESPTPRDVTFNAAVKRFVRGYEKEAHELSRQGEQLQKVYRDVLQKFGEPDNTASEDLFTSVRNFIDLFKKAVKDQTDSAPKKASTPQPSDTKKPSVGVVDQASLNFLAQIAAAAAEKTPLKKTSEEDSRGKNDNAAAAKTNLTSSAAPKPSYPPIPAPFSSPPSRETDGISLASGEPAPRPTVLGSPSNSSLSSVGSGTRDGGGGAFSPASTVSPIKDANSAFPPLSRRQSSGGAGSPTMTAIKRYSRGTISSTPPLAHKNLVQNDGSPFLARSFTVSGPVELPTMEGFMEKMSGGKKRAPKWDSRFFELCETGYLHYYRKKDSKCLGSVYLRGCPISVDPSDPCVIVLQSEDRTWYFRAQSSEEASAWKKALSFYTNR
ncbi:uncharacterized protein [Oscarella lobularis]|uniref:uncharacterized protein n=1 Tax=Oscarella lobularis TaxID=121494 RepID=UPI00331328F9